MKPFYIIAFSLLFTRSITAQWNQDTLVRNPVFTGMWDQHYPVIGRDGTRGYYIACGDDGPSLTVVRLQRADSAGYLLWPSNGVIVSPLSATWQHYPKALVADNSGGVYIGWHNGASASSETRVHHYNDSGQAMWPASVHLDGNQSNEFINNEKFCSDGKGGVIAAWAWNNNQGSYKARCQRIDKSGNLLWGAAPLAVASTGGGCDNLVSDGNSGALIVFGRNGTHHVQRVDSAGNLRWGNGVNLYRYRNFILHNAGHPACTDGNGGIYVPFDSIIPVYPYRQLYIHHVDSGGNLLTPNAGLLLAGSCQAGTSYGLIPDGAGGVINGYVPMIDSLNVLKTVIVKRMDSTGATLWSDTACTYFNSNKSDVAVVSDGAGGAIVCWIDYRHNNKPTLRSQHYDASGNRLWFAWGYPVCAAPNIGTTNPWLEFDMVAGDPGTAVVTWSDSRTGATNSYNIYMARIDGTVATAIGETGTIPLTEVWPNPSAGSFTVSFSKTIREGFIEIYAMNGSRVYAENIANEPGKHISLDNAVAGMYVIHINEGEQQYSAKMIIE